MSVILQISYLVKLDEFNFIRQVSRAKNSGSNSKTFQLIRTGKREEKFSFELKTTDECSMQPFNLTLPSTDAYDIIIDRSVLR